MDDFNRFKVKKCPPSVYYIPSFLSEEEEVSILKQIDNTPKPKWTQLCNRRLINYGGIPHKNGMIAEAMPSWLKETVTAVNNTGIFNQVKANHVLVNEYLPGQGIMPHTDGPLFHPIICTLTCGSHTILRFHKNNMLDKDCDDNNTMAGNIDSIVCQLLIEPRSLLIVKDDMYTDYLHSIADETHDNITADLVNLDQSSELNRIGVTIARNRRVSLTIRHVPKTSKFHLRLGH
ncbi:alpha-ketoglutarate-dependent dioxygenase alkB homolog 6 [Contarinia nasturtii]|uniref:alpha-ketoglutarate-dependent dioxygenase alkB homolog 6 n=1 Tax=Contarinia nasturtii TaxID=265458 RepID=UPI0012D37CDD|nr:alpha-ketoglutarate-dependent dioxygenase alkB homolog 6 [Contarinia nasturtii]